MSVYRIKEELPGERLVLEDQNSTLSFDSDKQLLSFESIRAFHTQSIALSFSVIEQVRLESRREKQNLQLTLTFISQGKRYQHELFVAQIDRHEEAADLFFRIATIMGAAGYFVRRSAEAYLDLELLAEAPKELPIDDPFRSLSYGAHALQEGSAREVPEIKERANYNDARGAFKEPTEVIGAFDPKSFTSKLEPTSFTHYKPGQRVELHRDLYRPKSQAQKSRIALIVALTLISAIVALVAVIAVMLPRDNVFAFVGLALVALGLLGGVAVLAMMIETNKIALHIVSEFIEQRSLTFDWSTNTLKIISQAPTRSIPFEEIEGMVLRSTKQRSDSDPQKKGLYLHRLVILLPGPDESLLCTEDNAAHPTRDEQIFRFMIEVCRELSVPWRVEIEQDPV